ncbi:TPA: hypothetical protein ACH3X2_014155 [Trebouxia sp. C0005]
MKIVTWNVNGLKAVLNRRFGSIRSLLQYLKADVVCIQETKLSKADVERFRELAICEGWDSYFSFCRIRGGYAGVATYCNTLTAYPVAAEDGMCGTLQLISQNSMVGSSERICFPDDQVFWNRFSKEHLEQIDNQGRCVITDHGMFVLLNVYGPAVTNEDNERFAMKMALYEVLQHRVEVMLAQGRSVVLVGDLNIAPYMVDHCDWCSKASQPTAQANFLKHRPDRDWFQRILTPGGGHLTDVFRRFHAGREKAYTVWNQKTGARTSNYGSRVDFILAAGPDKADLHSPAAGHGANHNSPAAVPGADADSPAADNEAAASSPAAPAGIHADTKQVPKDTPFVDRFTASDLWTECMGSDHCPVWADLDVPVPHLPKGFLPPALSTSHKFAGKANTISSWLTHSMTAATTSSRGRKRPRREEEDTPPRVSLEELEQQDRAQQKPRFGRAGLNQPFAAADQQPSPGRSVLSQPQAAANQQMTPGGAVLEQSRAAAKPEGTGGRSAARHHGQSTMKDFLTIAPAPQIGLPAAQHGLQEAHSNEATRTVGGDAAVNKQEQEARPGVIERGTHGPPLCKAHQEPCIKKRVNKSGPNKGRYFYMCSRPPAADDEGQCKTFKWANAPYQ